jgi:DNA invertase Pin-like site-specific DNA recombinase
VVALGYLSFTNGAERSDDPERRGEAERLERLCRHRGWTLAELIRETDPNRRGERPALHYALERLDRGEASCLVVPRLERLCRSVGEFGQVVERLNQVGARLVLLEPELDTATEAGAAAVQVLIRLSDREGEQLARRTRNGQAAAAASSVAARPAGVDGPKLKQRILMLRAEGMTLDAIADRLNREGVPTRSGRGQWRRSSVQAAVGDRLTRRQLSAQRSNGQNGDGNQPSEHTRR